MFNDEVRVKITKNDVFEQIRRSVCGQIRLEKNTIYRCLSIKSRVENVLALEVCLRRGHYTNHVFTYIHMAWRPGSATRCFSLGIALPQRQRCGLLHRAERYRMS